MGAGTAAAVGYGITALKVGAAAGAAYKTKKDLEGPKDVKSAKDLEREAAKAAERKRLARSGAKKESGATKFASAPSMGMNLKKKMGA